MAAKPKLRIGLLLGFMWAGGWSFASAQAGTNTLDFRVFWTPRAPSETPRSEAKPLLNGTVIVRTEQLPGSKPVARVCILLSRPSDESGREFWNTRLAFPEYEWMAQVRVWDKDNQWLWPNLAYLLRLHGAERVARYGGIDPGKGVDNDFAAVLIRKYDASGKAEDTVTQSRPLVSAEWHPVNVAGKVDRQSIVHEAQSDDFTLHLAAPGGQPQGMAAIWLVYADFLGAKVPGPWPSEPEFAGGILAYFEVLWVYKAVAEPEVRIQEMVPARSTGFDWEQWVARTRAARDSKSTARLREGE